MSGKITLYDLTRRGGNMCWSGNVWKTRQALNYKNIPYETEWVHHANIAEKLEKVVPEPNATGTPYTVPTIVLPDGTPVMGSYPIAEKLEQLHPTPSLHLDAGISAKIDAAFAKVGLAMLPMFMPYLAREVIVPESRALFEEKRAKAFGMPLAELEKTKGGEAAWEAMEPGLHDLSALLKEHKKDDGPFILGSQVSYGDFVINALIEGMSTMGPETYSRFVSFDPAFGKLNEACRPWTEKNGD